MNNRIRLWMHWLAIGLWVAFPLPGTASEAQPPAETDEMPGQAEEEDDQSDWSDPLTELLFGGPPVLSERIAKEREEGSRRFSLLSHKPNYVLPLAYSHEPLTVQSDNPAAIADEHLEIKFQISFKVPLWEEPLGTGTELAAGYTQQSWWQAYNSDASKPFRETNHAPELFFDKLTDVDVLGFTNRIMRFGVLHQSNGRADPFSRSWDRIYAQFVLERGGFVVSVRPWYRIPEGRSSDDNPDITDYLGHGDIGLVWRKGENVYSIMLRNNFDIDDNRGAIQVDWSFDISDDIRGYVQIFDGYGESLIDYDRSITRIGIGIQLTGWL